MTNFEVSVIFFLQLAAILAACQAVGWLARRVGQPDVVGQMIAGVLLGPSLLGWVWPEAYGWLFPQQSRSVIYVVAQVGLALTMFVVGLEFRVDMLRQKAKAAAAVSLSGVLTPFALGCGLAILLFDDHALFPEHIAQFEAMLFLGAALSITAFPMLAKIISERGLAGTHVGTLLLASGAIDDALAWCVLAIVLATSSDDIFIAGKAIVGTLLYALFAWAVLKPLLARWLPRGLGDRTAGRVREATSDATRARPPSPWPMKPQALLGVLVLLCLAAWYTDVIGIYAVFGAFVLGLVVPRGPVTDALVSMILPLSSVLLLPLFFVNSGLNTRITMMNTWSLWGVAGLVILAATIGKFVACALAARATGSDRRESLAIGAMMNARGLMELIILNIGLERGIITPVLFSIGVVMAIVTTLAATPGFDLFWRRGRASVPAPPSHGA